ncbi:unnamed protein product [Victoria cruziana]
MPRPGSFEWLLHGDPGRLNFFSSPRLFSVSGLSPPVRLLSSSVCLFPPSVRRKAAYLILLRRRRCGLGSRLLTTELPARLPVHGW